MAKKITVKAKKKLTEAMAVNQLSAAGFSGAQIDALRELFKAS